jgi:hypothetical protein
MTKRKHGSLEDDLRAYVRWLRRRGIKLVEIDERMKAHWPWLYGPWLRRFAREALREAKR